jgi:hypothetical protein
LTTFFEVVCLIRLQLQVKKHSVISKKWVNLVDEAVRRVQAGRIKMCNARLAVETVSATTSKTSTVANQGVRVFKLVAAHSAPAPDQPNQTLSSEEVSLPLAPFANQMGSSKSLLPTYVKQQQLQKSDG